MIGERRTQKPEGKGTNDGDPKDSSAPAAISTSTVFCRAVTNSADRENQANRCVDPHEISVDVAFTLRHPACFVSCQTNSLDKR